MKKLFILGDSISIQYRGYLQAMTRGVFSFEINAREKQRAERDLDNPEGLNGGDSSAVLKKLTAYSAQGLLDYDVMLLNCGLHDIKRDKQTGAYQVPLALYRDNLRQIAALLGAQPGRLCWVRTTPVDDARHNRLAPFDRFEDDVARCNAAADEILCAAGAAIIDLHGFTKNLGDDVYVDHVHYAEAVRAQQAAFIAGFICAL